MATRYVASEIADARPEPAAPAPSEVVQEREPEPVEWVLAACPELLAAARLRVDTEASCPFCGRRGRIVGVVSLEEWRRRLRHGVGWM